MTHVKVVKRLEHHQRKRRQHVPPAIVADAVNTLAMTQPMVDRLFWRAGFGPTSADRAKWVGKPVTDAVDWLLSTPGTPYVGTPATNDGAPLDVYGNDTDLVLGWVDAMVRTPNPLVERMTFYWHRHFANSRMDVSPPQLMATQNALFRLVRRSREQAGSRLQEPGLRRRDRPVDAALPDGRVERRRRTRTRTSRVS